MTTDEKINRYNAAMGWVAADAPATVEPPKYELLRRQDIVETTGKMIDAYTTQQRALLDQVQGETIGGRGGFLSDADQVAERRKTSGMYLRHYSFVTALAVGGIVLLAWSNGVVTDVSALAAWIAGTGIISLVLAWRRHGDEFAHSPEGIAHSLLDWHGSIAQYEAETRRLALQWEHDAERQRQAAAAAAAEYARQQAALRIAEIDARRRIVEVQRQPVETWSPAPQRRFVVEWQPANAQERPHGAIEGMHDVSNLEDGCSVPGTPTAVDAGASWQAALLAWVAGLYEPGKLTANGVIKGQTPWAARSAWVDADKAHAKRVCCEMRPKLIEPSDGGRWRVRLDLVADAEQAIQVLSQRL